MRGVFFIIAWIVRAIVACAVLLFLFLFFLALLTSGGSMAKRGKMPSGHSKRVFTRGAMQVHRKNGLQGGSASMRGGIRL